MKKLLISLLLWSLVVFAFWLSSHQAFASTTGLVASWTKTIYLVPSILQKKILPSFPLVGMSAELDGMLLLERYNLHHEWVTNRSLNVLRKFLKKYSKKSLPHLICKTGVYKPLWHDFYKQIGTVIPSYNTIETYRIKYDNNVWSKAYIVWSWDGDKYHDNCNDEYATLDDKPAQCARNMRAYFGNHEFEILSCR